MRSQSRPRARACGVVRHPQRARLHQELLALDGIDLVTIGAPNVFHAPATIDALRSGRHVLCEKPIATTSADARKMVAEARKRGLVLGVNQHMRFDPAARRDARGGARRVAR